MKVSELMEKYQKENVNELHQLFSGLGTEFYRDSEPEDDKILVAYEYDGHRLYVVQDWWPGAPVKYRAWGPSSA